MISIGLASLFAAIGLWQEATKDLFFYSPQLEVSNAYSPFFRVTSLFTDPSLYGRHLVLGFAVLLVLVWTNRINLYLATGIGTLLFAGLYFSYSQTSMASLFAVAFVVTLVAGDPPARRAVVASAVVVVAAAAFVVVGARDESIGDVTSGRWTRVERTADVVREAPLFGVGLGAQPEVSQDLAEQNGARTARFVSHTTPLTVAAELGIVGLVIYGLLLAAAIRMIMLLRERDVALGLSLGAVLLALFVHALAYSGFFEDPGHVAHARDRRRLPRRPRRGARHGAGNFEAGAGGHRPADHRQVTRREAGRSSAFSESSSPSPCPSSAPTRGRSHASARTPKASSARSFAPPTASGTSGCSVRPRSSPGSSSRSLRRSSSGCARFRAGCSGSSAPP